MSHESVCTILVDVLEMWHVAEGLVPNKLKFFQKEHHKQVDEDMLSWANLDPISIKHIIMVDKMWVYEFDMEASKTRFRMALR